MNEQKHLPPQTLIELSDLLLSSEDWSGGTLYRARSDAIELLAPLIDQTLLKPEASAADVLLFCEQSKNYRFASICVHSYWLPSIQEWLGNHPIKRCCVVGFPSGMIATKLKQNEIQWSLEHGVDEIDVVWNLGAVHTGDWIYIENELKQLLEVSGNHVLKVIFETATLSDQQIRQGCEICAQIGISFVKTSTGFHPSGGATEHAVSLMRQSVGSRCGVKASGGIRDLRTALRMIRAGANRIGTSNGVSILETFN
ncbi:MAG: deoxyribose-phosphate aldolase [bacterium]|nr:deoxyribose-phosphate aldolase [bacterium]